MLAGTTKITRDIFTGGDKSENALLFLENLDKVKSKKKPEVIQNKNRDVNESFELDSASITQKTMAISDEPSNVEAKQAVDLFDSDIEEEQNENVLLNISPKKFEKPKDQLFIDFFSMYTKRFVEDQKSGNDSKQSIKLEGKKQS